MCSRPPRAPKGLEPHQVEAFQADEAVSAVARGLGVFDLALGATVARLFEGDRLAKLSYARESDYARERLGMSPAALSSCVRLARELRHRPILRAAVTAGAVSPRKALAVLPQAVGDYEGAWTEAAMRLSVRELEGAAKAAGCALPEERFEAEVLVLPMTREQQDRLDAALAVAKEDIGPEAKRWQCMEAICEEYLSTYAEFDP
ncbi:MAG TPA: HNH endonuclease, partial [Planctomycetota bacterium]|nr:HNH endonuclease [Planctomycetota bacterium]